MWILGLKPSTGGSLKAGRGTTDANAVITTAVMADLPVLSAMLSRLFESSQFLNDVALHHLIDALCKLSHEAMELAYCNRVCTLSWISLRYCHFYWNNLEHTQVHKIKYTKYQIQIDWMWWALCFSTKRECALTSTSIRLMKSTVQVV